MNRNYLLRNTFQVALQKVINGVCVWLREGETTGKSVWSGILADFQCLVAAFSNDFCTRGLKLHEGRSPCLVALPFLMTLEDDVALINFINITRRPLT